MIPTKTKTIRGRAEKPDPEMTEVGISLDFRLLPDRPVLNNPKAGPLTLDMLRVLTMLNLRPRDYVA